ncbi:DUF6908 domain-containing protein [Teredinibacter purpureus]|uniref:DUF6908 domain-containing protein n=1 Tax=Teredinibacter purpureus TaxID=2731756 RepID=UPI0005F79CBC|nr:hypothetical protein [Teredinibacter purpureus]
MRKTVYETNYDRLVKLGIVTEGQIRPNGRSQSGGYMDLVLERLPHLDNVYSKGSLAVSIAHYFEQNGDLCSDPEMVLLLHPEIKSVEAFSFNQSLPPYYQEVFPEPGKVCLAYKKDQNNFLRTWLTNLINQRHGKTWADSMEAA